MIPFTYHKCAGRVTTCPSLGCIAQAIRPLSHHPTNSVPLFKYDQRKPQIYILETKLSSKFSLHTTFRVQTLWIWKCSDNCKPYESSNMLPHCFPVLSAKNAHVTHNLLYTGLHFFNESCFCTHLENVSLCFI